MATVVSAGEAEATLARLIDRAIEGEEIVIERAGTPVVKLTAVTADPETKPKRQFPFGLMKGKIHIHPSFYEPMTDEELALFYGAEDDRLS